MPAAPTFGSAGTAGARATASAPESAPFSNITVAKEARVAVVSLSAPRGLNILNGETLVELERALSAIAADESVDVVLLRSAHPKVFTAGADISEMRQKDVMTAREFSELGHRVARALETLPQPVVAAVHGAVMGGGLEFILACDIRIAADDAVFAQPEVDIGIIPGWGGTQRLARIVGVGMAKELIYTGRRIDAKEALRIGLVNEVVPRDRLDDAALSFAQGIACKSRPILLAAKRAINKTMESPLPVGLDYEVDAFANVFATSDRTEGMCAFLEKRPPRFEDR